MRLPFAILLVSARAIAGPGQLPKVCAAESPSDEPCTAITGRYQIDIAPDGDSCVLAKPVSATVTIQAGGKVDAAQLQRAVGLTDKPTFGAAIRKGVCCIDFTLYGTKNKKPITMILHLAAGASLVEAKGRACTDEDLKVNAKRLH